MEVMLLIFGIFLAYVIYSRVSSNTTEKKRTPPSRVPILKKTSSIDETKDYFHWPEIGYYDFQVVGESNYQNSIRTIANNHGYDPNSRNRTNNIQLTAYLVPENDNAYDNKAVRVDIENLTVGYISKEDARSFRRRLGAKKLSGQITCCLAQITGGHTKNGKVHSYGIQLDIQPFGQIN